MDNRPTNKVPPLTPSLNQSRWPQPCGDNWSLWQPRPKYRCGGRHVVGPRIHSPRPRTGTNPTCTCSRFHGLRQKQKHCRGYHCCWHMECSYNLPNIGVTMVSMFSHRLPQRLHLQWHRPLKMPLCGQDMQSKECKCSLNTDRRLHSSMFGANEITYLKSMPK